MADYHIDLEKDLKQSPVNHARLQHIVSRIDVDRNNLSATKHKVKKFYWVASILIGLLAAVVPFRPLVSDLYNSSIPGTKSSMEVPPLELSLNADGNYTGFSNLPENYSVDDAKKDGYVVDQDLVVIANNEKWNDFVTTAAQGHNTSIRIASFLTEDTSSPFFRDLFFNDGYYYLFNSSSEQQDVHRFSYLLTLDGQFGNPSKNKRIVILTNDKALTFDVVMKSLLSSNMDYKQSVPLYRLVFLNV